MIVIKHPSVLAWDERVTEKFGRQCRQACGGSKCPGTCQVCLLCVLYPFKPLHMFLSLLFLGYIFCGSVNCNNYTMIASWGDWHAKKSFPSSSFESSPPYQHILKFNLTVKPAWICLAKASIYSLGSEVLRGRSVPHSSVHP